MTRKTWIKLYIAVLDYPAAITWLAEWRLNGSISWQGTFPPPGKPETAEPRRSCVPSPEETRRILDEKDEILKKAVPPPEAIRIKMRDLKKKLAREDGP
jgi:hypothetical protein